MQVGGGRTASDVVRSRTTELQASVGGASGDSWHNVPCRGSKAIDAAAGSGERRAVAKQMVVSVLLSGVCRLFVLDLVTSVGQYVSEGKTSPPPSHFRNEIGSGIKSESKRLSRVPNPDALDAGGSFDHARFADIPSASWLLS